MCFIDSDQFQASDLIWIQMDHIGLHGSLDLSWHVKVFSILF